MDPIVSILADPILLAIGLVVGAVFHEGGHAVFAALAGIRPRVVNIGVGRPLLRFKLRGTWILLRICPLAPGWMVPELSESRWARVAMVAGGPLSNLILLGLLYAVTLIAPETYDTLEPIGFIQVGAVVLTLFPTRQTVQGVSTPTDGLFLLHLLFRPMTVDIGARHAALLRSVQPDEAAPHPRTRHATEILYQAGRRDRWSEAWAARDTIACVEGSLSASDLSTDERAYLLSFLAIAALMASKPQATGAEMEAWSSQALSLASGPRTLLARGAVLVEGGDREQGETLIQNALQTFEARHALHSLESVLGHAFMGRIRAAEARDWAAQGHAEAATKLDNVAARWFVLARKLALKSPPALLRVIDRLERLPLDRTAKAA